MSEKIRIANGKLQVPDHPVIPFIEGDGTGPDIWRASVRVFDAAVNKAFGGKKKIVWFEVPAGEKAKAQYGEWLPNDTIEAVNVFPHLVRQPRELVVIAHVELEDRRLDRQPLRDPAGDPQSATEVRDQNSGAFLLGHLRRCETDRRLHRDPGDEDVLAFENAHWPMSSFARKYRRLFSDPCRGRRRRGSRHR